MAKDSSFDIVSQVDMQEMSNALLTKQKRNFSSVMISIGSIASIELEDKKQLKSQQKMIIN